jgi:hypothetical protein
MKQPLYFAPEKIGPKQSFTPEGFLLCEDVGIARTGVMLYGPGETPIEAGPSSHIVKVDRTEDEVFRPEFMASLVGKSVTNNHPPVDVDPDNLHDYEVGVVLNPHRGKGAEDDILFADLLIKDRTAINLVRKGKREISAGYDAGYVQTAPGMGRQIHMVANHVALVDSGRCGSRCAIGDQLPTILQQEKKKMTFKERILNAFKSRDENSLTALLDEVPESATTAVHVHVHDNANPGENEKGEKEGTEGKPKAKPTADKRDEDEEEDSEGRHRFTDAEIGSRFDKLDKKVTDLASTVKKVLDKKAKDEDEEEEEEETEGKTKDSGIEAEIPQGVAKTKDSACLEEPFRQTVALAEIIAPGIQVPTFDKKADSSKGIDVICSLRRKALDQAYANDSGVKELMDEMLTGRRVTDMACQEVRPVFAAVAAFKKRSNNSEQRTTDFGIIKPTGTIKTAADLNKRNAEFYK